MSDNGMKQRLVDAYYRMLGRMKTTLEQAEHEAGPAIGRAVERAEETATELGELTREEAERVGGYLKRDMEDAGRFLAKGGSELADWLKFDLQLVEKGLADLFTQTVLWASGTAARSPASVPWSARRAARNCTSTTSATSHPAPSAAAPPSAASPTATNNTPHDRSRSVPGGLTGTASCRDALRFPPNLPRASLSVR